MGLLFLLSFLAVLGILLWTLPPPGQEGMRVTEALCWCLLFFVWAIPWLVPGSGRTRITERGFQLGARLLPWNHIESWQWFGQRLVLALKKGVGVTVVWGTGWGRAKVYLPVPAEQKAAVERVLAGHLPAARTSPGAEAGQASL